MDHKWLVIDDTIDQIYSRHPTCAPLVYQHFCVPLTPAPLFQSFKILPMHKEYTQRGMLFHIHNVVCYSIYTTWYVIPYTQRGMLFHIHNVVCYSTYIYTPWYVIPYTYTQRGMLFHIRIHNVVFYSCIKNTSTTNSLDNAYS